MDHRVIRPRRSVLYMPGANARALEKAREIDCDGLIFDLEDAVAPGAKALARDQVRRSVDQGGYGHREVVVRCNGLDTPWGAEDIQCMATIGVDALLFPKIENAAQVEALLVALDAAGASDVPLWVMIETPGGVLNVRDIAAADHRVSALVLGTSDLVTELRARHTDSRVNLSFALQRCVLAARECGIDVLDGVHLDFRNLDGLRRSCEQGRDMGFDGKTLIHPGQVVVANEVFGIDAEETARAEAILEAWEQAQAQGRGVVELDGQLIENLHVAEAKRQIAYARALLQRDS